MPVITLTIGLFVLGLEALFMLAALFAKWAIPLSWWFIWTVIALLLIVFVH